MVHIAVHLCRLALVGCVTLAGILPPAGHSGPSIDADEAICRELQFRRLHLVRPDLIRYPLMFEVYC